ncbi:MAG TPA: hypothetical protein VKV74_14835 [Bryobacteraceae bacterium]|nr:hypothetical protein [Bryobacteraceae bacterium]
MRFRLAAILLALAPLFAQEGHPLVGSWHGDWGPNAKDRTDITLILNYDGKNVVGMINPGPDVAKLQNAALDASNWGVHFEADLKDRTGKLVHIIADGKLEDVTSARRRIVGAWSQGGVKGDFKITRDD